MTRYSSPRKDPKDLEKFGPRLEIEVRLPIIRPQDKSRLPQFPKSGPERSSRMPALIDTGAGRTVLTPQAVQKVGLPLVNHTMLSRAGGMSPVSTHVASIHFPREKLATIEVIEILCCELPEQSIQCLIGRDIIARWLLIYNGRAGAWAIEEEDIAPWVEPPEDSLT